MLAYAFRVLSERGYANISPEQFENTANLLSAILDKGVTQLIKRGIRNDYIPIVESTGSPIGKINIAESIKSQYVVTHRLVCEYEEFKSDILLNQIIKASIKVAISSNEVDSTIKKSLRKSLLNFQNISDINPKTILWLKIRYDRNNASYKMLVHICYLLVTGLLQSENKGSMKIANIIDDQKMHRLYERFILEYYKRHYPAFNVSASHIPWDSDDGMIDFLPTMKTDVTIKYGDKILVIDAKYYSHSMQSGQYDKRTMHSNNMYQIYTYVKNLDPHQSGNVSGLLLYAKTDEDVTPNNEYKLNGNSFKVMTLDLNLPFEAIAKQLDDIITEWTSDSANNIQKKKAD
ncbi:MAG: 5-methylcytosine-specific restriction endonuclease system specificity protein McrC [Alistipes sp.]|nr:5-methylcytosine-specific restriction endonuclease system specificity protein McrC [Alistipes sp.]